MKQEGQLSGENTANTKSSHVVPYLIYSHFRTSPCPVFDCLQCTKMEGKSIYHVMMS